MSAPTASPSYVPSTVTPQLADAARDADFTGSFRSMASDVHVRIGAPADVAAAAFAQVEQLFRDVETQCTRFNPDSDLMRANAAAQEWLEVGTHCYRAVAAAARAHLMTAGLFDPRVLRTLCELGYDRSLAFAAGDVHVDGTAGTAPAALSVWTPGLDAARLRVRIGPDPIDLGGIGKGLAVRWAAEHLAAVCSSFIVEAGGDCYLSGAGLDGNGWNVGVEDPRGGRNPVAVLAVRDQACATSSIRLRTWKVAGKTAHHLVDPRTGAPGGAGLLSVSVVGPDPAEAEVWSKVLFLHGAQGIAEAAERFAITALWVEDDGTLHVTPAAAEHVIWQAS